MIPLLPLSFLFSPSLWRAACPLATLDLLGGAAASVPGRGWTEGRTANRIGILLLVGLIPARRVVLEFQAPALATLLLGIAGMAWLAGRTRPAKGGFCNAVCPILPVERLYGHDPLLHLDDTSCRPCVRCTSVGCMDRAPREALLSLADGARQSGPWLRTVPGLFAGSFPGLIVAFGLLPDPGPVSPLRAYGQVLIGMAVAWLVVALAVALRRPTLAGLVRRLAALSAGLFYWFAAPHMAAALEAGPAAGQLLRAGMLGVVAWWALRPAGGFSRGGPRTAGSRSTPG